jgi:beta-phosphoglucomutase-like phosphatase (HAD superfamily)
VHAAVAAPPVGATPPVGAAPPLPAAPLTQLVYSGVVFDMDGTLAVSKIDYKTMRQKTGIPVGDLFTVMERCGGGTWVGCSCLQEPLLLKSRDSTATTHVSSLPPHLCYSWDDGDRIKASMDTILELEAQASASLEAMPGLLSLLAFLRASGIKVGLITRNTTESLNAFFAGELRAA